MDIAFTCLVWAMAQGAWKTITVLGSVLAVTHLPPPRDVISCHLILVVFLCRVRK